MQKSVVCFKWFFRSTTLLWYSMFRLSYSRWSSVLSGTREILSWPSSYVTVIVVLLVHFLTTSVITGAQVENLYRYSFRLASSWTYPIERQKWLNWKVSLKLTLINSPFRLALDIRDPLLQCRGSHADQIDHDYTQAVRFSYPFRHTPQDRFSPLKNGLCCYGEGFHTTNHKLYHLAANARRFHLHQMTYSLHLCSRNVYQGKLQMIWISQFRREPDFQGLLLLWISHCDHIYLHYLQTPRLVSFPFQHTPQDLFVCSCLRNFYLHKWLVTWLQQMVVIVD